MPTARATGPPTFTLPANAPVTATTGSVFTLAAEPIRFVNPQFATGWDTERNAPRPLGARQGEIAHILAYHGEGIYDIWMRGRAVTGVDLGGLCAERCSAETLDPTSRADTEWWAKVADRRGRNGWVRVTRDNFVTPSCH